MTSSNMINSKVTRLQGYMNLENIQCFAKQTKIDVKKLLTFMMPKLQDY